MFSFGSRTKHQGGKEMGYIVGVLVLVILFQFFWHLRYRAKQRFRAAYMVHDIRFNSYWENYNKGYEAGYNKGYEVGLLSKSKVS